MPQMPSHELPERTHLPARHGLTGSLTALPLDLSEFPFILAVRNLPAVGPDEELPLQYRRIEYEWQTPEGARHKVVITGDPRLGLPYGRMDALVLLAIMTLAAQQLPREGEFDGRLQTSFREICSTMGLEVRGKTLAAIQAAIRRFHALRVVGRVVRETEQIALAVLDGYATPTSPTRTLVRMRRETGEKPPIVIAYSWIEEEHLVRDSGPTGHELMHQHVLQWIELNPQFVQQAIAGWAAWIDRDLVLRMNSDCAVRLYMVLAGQAAQEADPDPTWRLGLKYLRASCGVTSTKRRDVKRVFARAFDELIDLGVVDQVSDVNDTYCVRPGRVLKAAHLLRGVGALDQPDTQMLVALMRRYGIEPKVSRPLIAAKPNIVYRVLAYATYLEETNPQKIKKSWSGFILQAIERNMTYATETEFLRWLANGCRKLEAAEEQAIQAELQALQTNEPCQAPAEDDVAPSIWSLVCSEALAGKLGEKKPTAIMVQHLAPRRVTGETLVLASSNDFYREWLADKAQAPLEELLRERTRGQLQHIRIERWTAPDMTQG